MGAETRGRRASAPHGWRRARSHLATERARGAGGACDRPRALATRCSSRRTLLPSGASAWRDRSRIRRRVGALRDAVRGAHRQGTVPRAKSRCAPQGDGTEAGSARHVWRRRASAPGDHPARARGGATGKIGGPRRARGGSRRVGARSEDVASAGAAAAAGSAWPGRTRQRNGVRRLAGRRHRHRRHLTSRRPGANRRLSGGRSRDGAPGGDRGAGRSRRSRAHSSANRSAARGAGGCQAFLDQSVRAKGKSTAVDCRRCNCRRRSRLPRCLSGRKTGLERKADGGSGRAGAPSARGEANRATESRCLARRVRRRPFPLRP